MHLLSKSLSIDLGNEGGLMPPSASLGFALIKMSCRCVTYILLLRYVCYTRLTETRITDGSVS